VVVLWWTIKGVVYNHHISVYVSDRGSSERKGSLLPNERRKNLPFHLTNSEFNKQYQKYFYSFSPCSKSLKKLEMEDYIETLTSTSDSRKKQPEKNFIAVDKLEVVSS
jgi:hypothetical protein